MFTIKIETTTTFCNCNKCSPSTLEHKNLIFLSIVEKSTKEIIDYMCRVLPSVCEVCQSVKCNISAKIKNYPKTLFINLNWFYQDDEDEEKAFPNKSNNRINIEDTLELVQIEYFLSSVCHYVGTNAEGGHYYCDYFDIITGNWFRFNEKT